MADHDLAAGGTPDRASSLTRFLGAGKMPYALFCNDAQISKAYPSESDVWKLAQRSGLVVDVVADDERPGPRRVLDNGYEIASCQAAHGEDPAKNKAEADQQTRMELELNS
ncbi:hypothetical protein ACVIU7_000722 [Bradyrhizobium liaoningense]